MGTHSLVTMALVAEEEEGMVLSRLWLWHTCVLTLGALQFQHPPGALVSAHNNNSLSRVYSRNGLAWHGLKLPEALGYGLVTHTGDGHLSRLRPCVCSKPHVTALDCMAQGAFARCMNAFARC